MQCIVTINHKSTNKEAITEGLEKIFGEKTIPNRKLYEISGWFEDFPGVSKNIIYSNSVGELIYTFLQLDLKNTQVWVKCRMGGQTFHNLERIVGNGIKAIELANGKSAKCKIEHSSIYEQTDKDSLDLGIEINNWITNLRKSINLQNLITLIVIWGLSAISAWFSTPVEDRELQLLVTPSLYAPIGVLVAIIGTAGYNSIRKRNNVVINVAKRT